MDRCEAASPCLLEGPALPIRRIGGLWRQSRVPLVVNGTERLSGLLDRHPV